MRREYKWSDDEVCAFVDEDNAKLLHFLRFGNLYRNVESVMRSMQV